MKSLLLTAVALVCVVGNTYAIEVSLGPAVAAKGSVNTVSPGTGLKTGFAFNSMPDLGLTTRMLLSKDSNLGLLLDVEMTGYGYIMRPENEDFATDANTYVSRHSYVNIAPSLYLGGLTLGIGILLPTGLTNKSVDGSDELFLVGTQASPVLEARLGAMIPLVRSSSGDLNFTIRGTYMLGGHFTKEVRYVINSSNPQSAGLSIGLNYLFSVVK
ncbi:MAG: hypothetical protein FGM33_08350 [Candidatus Kapabacteria bacterium]|nr:hypothetical protein [Candidatus Kapabacteria bacterium]